VPADGHPARAARHAADRGHVRHRRERHPQRHRQGPRHGQRAADPHRGRLGPRRGRDPADGARRRGARRGGPAGQGPGRRQELGRAPDLHHREVPLRPRRPGRRGHAVADRDGPGRPAVHPRDGRRGHHPPAEPGGDRGVLQAGRGGLRPGAGPGRRRRRQRRGGRRWLGRRDHRGRRDRRPRPRDAGV
ncbi:MAG: Chaperone protein DnaK, partial [uncultured Thermoleophilia bacterium]